MYPPARGEDRSRMEDLPEVPGDHDEEEKWDRQEDLYHVQEVVGLSLIEMQGADPTLQEVREWVEKRQSPLERKPPGKLMPTSPTRGYLSAYGERKTGC